MKQNDRNDERQNEEAVPQSAAARIMYGLGKDQENGPEIVVQPVSALENFWYHHKWPTLIIAFFVIVTIICSVQMCSKESPDVYFTYAGPFRFTQAELFGVRDSFRQLMDDYNGDGERGIGFNDFTYYNAQQLEQLRKEAEEAGASLLLDSVSNQSVLESFNMEMMAGDSVICLLDPALYATVKSSGILMPLAEVLGDLPESAIDEYGIRLSETDFSRYFTAMQILPDDTVLCIRRLTVISAVKGQAKMEKLHGYHRELFCAVVNFRLPDGFEETTGQTEPGV